MMMTTTMMKSSMERRIDFIIILWNQLASQSVDWEGAAGLHFRFEFFESHASIFVLIEAVHE